MHRLIQAIVNNLYSIENKLDLHPHGTLFQAGEKITQDRWLCSSNKKSQRLKAIQTSFMSVLCAHHELIKDSALSSNHHFLYSRTPADEVTTVWDMPVSVAVGKEYILEDLESAIECSNSVIRCHFAHIGQNKSHNPTHPQEGNSTIYSEGQESVWSVGSTNA